MLAYVQLLRPQGGQRSSTSRRSVGIEISNLLFSFGKFTYPAKQKTILAVHAIGDFPKNWPFEEFLIFVAQEIAQDVAPLEIHAAESNVAIWEKNIPILSFLSTCQCSDHARSSFDDPRIDASTSATQRSRPN
ncbi:hypothetical protein ATC00_12300 [Sinorhizobium americanum]|nr:hypothetical protein ATC00_12300 [Sinorhizobium americanum]